MNMDIYEKFRLWYKEPIECLIAKDEHTGFAVLMLALPILERYLRQRLKITTDGLPDIFYDEMVQMFPALKTSPYAKRFWKCYRNGLLHQATLQLRDGPQLSLCTTLFLPWKLILPGPRSRFLQISLHVA